VHHYILHITSRVEWSAAKKSGQYSADSLAGQGFIHCSNIGQVVRVADSFFSGHHDLVLLLIDPVRLKSELRWEPGVDLGTELFPHIYGPINLDALMEVLDLECDTDGKFHLPQSLQSADS
jgi:uncharacterized protein (DUF952 family)